jgi:hypothetical protein
VFFEENLTEWLGACICTVILRSDMGHSNQFLSYMLPEVMILHINVFGSRPHLMHHGQFHSTRVVLKNLHCTMGMQVKFLLYRSLVSLTKFISGMVDLRALDISQYSLSVVDNVTSVSIFEDQTMERLAYIIMCPPRDFAVMRS